MVCVGVSLGVCVCVCVVLSVNPYLVLVGLRFLMEVSG